MNKNMYSLMLMDDVVKAVDKYAYRHNTNRSNVVNQILAEYLQVQTPEMISKEIFSLISELIDDEVFNIVNNPSQTMLSIRSSLEYKYRPTIRYNFELYRDFQQQIGQLTVVFRTQSEKFLKEIEQFFQLWLNLEAKYSSCEMQYLAKVGRYVRSIRLLGVFDNQDISKEISHYILLFDEVLKKYLNQRYSNIEEMEEDYRKLRSYYQLTI